VLEGFGFCWGRGSEVSCKLWQWWGVEAVFSERSVVGLLGAADEGGRPVAGVARGDQGRGGPGCDGCGAGTAPPTASGRVKQVQRRAQPDCWGLAGLISGVDQGGCRRVGGPLLRHVFSRSKARPASVNLNGNGAAKERARRAKRGVRGPGQRGRRRLAGAPAACVGPAAGVGGAERCVMPRRLFGMRVTLCRPPWGVCVCVSGVALLRCCVVALWCCAFWVWLRACWGVRARPV
jgi:hypothetical protein